MVKILQSLENRSGLLNSGKKVLPPYHNEIPISPYFLFRNDISISFLLNN
jgi:hypothetical protein